MNNVELKHQIKDLNKVLNRYIDNVENGEKHIEYIITVAKLSPIIKTYLDNMESVRNIKKRKLVNEFIKTLSPFDIHEALDIEVKAVREKIKKNDFSLKEKNIILNTFAGSVSIFLNEYKN